MEKVCSTFSRCKKCESLFRYLIELYSEKKQFLDVQFRGNPRIFNLSSSVFYDGKIKSDPSTKDQVIQYGEKVYTHIVQGVANKNPINCLNVSYTENPVIWYPDWQTARYKKIDQSCVNLYEAALTIKTRHALIQSGIDPESIWILTPYRLQKELISKSIQKMYGKKDDNLFTINDIIHASTVDSIQGKENDVVIFSLTWSKSKYNNKQIISKALKDYRRLNVALTRAKKKIILIGDFRKITYKYPYGALYKYLKEKEHITHKDPESLKDEFYDVVNLMFKTITGELEPSYDEIVETIEEIPGTSPSSVVESVRNVPHCDILTKKANDTYGSRTWQEYLLFTSSSRKKKYEDNAYVLSTSKQSINKYDKASSFAVVLGDRYYTLLELDLGNHELSTGDYISLGKKNRQKFETIIGKIHYFDLRAIDKKISIKYTIPRRYKTRKEIRRFLPRQLGYYLHSSS
jgi:superfamily I DNA and/or RNA helicase